MLIGDMLYGNTGEDMRIRLNSVEEFEKNANLLMGISSHAVL